MLLTSIMAFLTRSFFIRPAENRLSINSLLVEPEQYHAMDKALLGFAVSRILRCLMLRVCLQLFGAEAVEADAACGCRDGRQSNSFLRR